MADGITVKGTVSIVGNRGVYMGNGKGGRYASGNFMVKNPKGYGHWVSFYAPGTPAVVLEGAQENEPFEIEGYLDETKRKKQDGTEERKEQIVVTHARRLAASPAPQRDSMESTYVQDEDIPAWAR
jgi:hypothetical protein